MWCVCVLLWASPQLLLLEEQDEASRDKVGPKRTVCRRMLRATAQ